MYFLKLELSATSEGAPLAADVSFAGFAAAGVSRPPETSRELYFVRFLYLKDC